MTMRKVAFELNVFFGGGGTNKITIIDNYIKKKSKPKI